jgi:hypothetical protein
MKSLQSRVVGLVFLLVPLTGSLLPLASQLPSVDYGGGDCPAGQVPSVEIIYFKDPNRTQVSCISSPCAPTLPCDPTPYSKGINICCAKPASAGKAGPFTFQEQAMLYVQGHEIKTLGGTTLPACRKACLALDTCASYSFSVAGGNCFLSSETFPTSWSFNFVFGQKVDLPVGGTPPDPIETLTTGFREKKGQVYPGYDITSKIDMTLSSCREFCASYPSCLAFDFENTGVCWLNFANYPAQANAAFTVGGRELWDRDTRVHPPGESEVRAAQAAFLEEKDVSLGGETYYSILRTNLLTCRQKCFTEKECRAFSFHATALGECELKREVSGKTPWAGGSIGVKRP